MTDSLLRHSHGPRPPIICLCGSTRFKTVFEQIASRETLAGKLVLTVNYFGNDDGQPAKANLPHTSPRDKIRLNELHKRKIDLADEVLVLNVGGYIGHTTQAEIDYARYTGKPVRFLEQPDQPVVTASHQRKDGDRR